MNENWIEDLSGYREDYHLSQLNVNHLSDNPFELFHLWFQDCLKSSIPEPNAMILATANVQGKPSARVVLLKKYGYDGLVFFTNYTSRKGEELTANPFASLCFFWPQLERQIRIEGEVEKLDVRLSDEYFQSRPVGSRLGAWISPQSKVISGKEELIIRRDELQARFQNQTPPRPDFWGGFLLRPNSFEFWQGRPDRMHDRFLYSKHNDEWQICRLAP